MNGININEIGVVALSQSEEYDIAGGWDWYDFGSDVLGGAAIGGLTAAATGGAFWPAVGLGALCGATWYVWNEVKDTIRPVE